LTTYPLIRLVRCCLLVVAKTTAFSVHHEQRENNLHASYRLYLSRISTWLLFTLRNSSQSLT